MVLALLQVWPAAAARASVSPTLWTGSGPGSTSVVSDGTTDNPKFSYSLNPAGLNATQTWTFQTTAVVDGSVTVPYAYSGFHAYFQVRVELTAFVEHLGTRTPVSLVTAGPTDCCSPPSAGFSYSGTHDFTVLAGDTYGFTFGGSNFDSNNVLSGTLTLPFLTAPYVDGATIAENTSWPNAASLGAAGVDAVLGEAGQARWYKVPVMPDGQVQFDLTNLAQNYDLTVYSDIKQAFGTLTSTTDLAKLGVQFAGDAYSPSIYSPSIYSPSIYSPSIYSPSIYSPSIYSPSIYSPSIYSPSIYSPSIYSPSIYSPSIYSPSTAFTQAFSGAQTRSLLGISAHDGVASESLRLATWNNTGDFYVRVQGRNGAYDATHPFHLSVTSTGTGPCTGFPLSTYDGDSTLVGTAGSAGAVILTDRSRTGLGSVADADGQTAASYTTALAGLAARTDGAVVDVADSTKVQHLNQQADAHPSCAYAKNLVAQAIRDIVNSYRSDAGRLKYVVITGPDSVIPFFRYADAAGIGPENGYVPPVLDGTASQASLRSNNVLGQDAYGSQTDLTLKGSAFPVPDLAVGRLVETPGEVVGQIDTYLGLTGGTLPTPSSSLVTGYDFLTSSADAVQAELSAGTGRQGDTLITNQGVPTTTTTTGGAPDRTHSWTAADLKHALLDSRHDLVYLAGHFSANSALAADYQTSILTTDLEAHPRLLQNSLVFSAGCHSGYNLVDSDGVPGVTLGLDWAQAMARQRATLIAGTGYQYADTDFLAYSAKLYTQVAHQLRTGAAGTPVAVGQALVKAKRDYLASTATLTGIDRKALLEATLYGLPMTGIDLPHRAPGPPPPATLTVAPVAAGTPGNTLGLQTTSLSVAPDLTAHSKPVLDLAGTATGANYHWYSGPDGVTTTPAVPALPLQFSDVTSDGGVLRGVGFRTGTYADAAGVTPLTGAPTTEQNGLHTSFASPAFFPQRLATPNFYGAVGGTGGDGRSRLAVTGVQYRSEPGTATNTERAYSQLGLQLFYSANTTTYGANTPALSAAPSLSEVTGTVVGGALQVSAHVTGDPSAGIQQVWVTYTAEAGPFHGSWQSLDLTQDLSDSTLWTAVLPLPAGQAGSDVRFLLQAANGVGLVGFDNNLGDGYTPDVPVGNTSVGAAPTTLAFDGPTVTSGAYGDNVVVGATVTAAGVGVAGATITFGLGSNAVAALTDGNGHASASLPLRDAVGSYPLIASFAGSSTLAPAAATVAGLFTIAKAPTLLTVSTSSLPLPVVGDTHTTARLTSSGVPLGQRPVQLHVTNGSGAALDVARITDLDGRVSLGPLPLMTGPHTVTATFGSGGAGTAPDPSYGASTATASFLLDEPPTLQLPATIAATATSTAGAAVTYLATATSPADGTVPVSCLPASGTVFPLGTTTVSCGATNRAGELTTGTFLVTVTYAWSGFLDPIVPDGSKIFNKGSTVPVKFALTGASAAVTNAVGRFSYRLMSTTTTRTGTTPNAFRYDQAKKQYIYNWSTSGLPAGAYLLTVELGDGVLRSVTVTLR